MVSWRSLLALTLLLCGCEMVAVDEQSQHREVAEQFQREALRLYERGRYQGATLQAQAWAALEPESGAAATLLQKIQASQHQNFARNRNCTDRFQQESRVVACMKRQLRFQPDHKPAIQALRRRAEQAELARLETEFVRLESGWREAGQAMQAAEQPAAPALPEPVNAPAVQLRQSRATAQIQEVARLVDVGEWKSAARMLLNIEARWLPDSREFHDLRNSLVAQLYTQGQRLFRRDIHAAIEFWELVVAIDANHNLARIKLVKAYKIRSNLEAIN